MSKYIHQHFALKRPQSILQRERESEKGGGTKFIAENKETTVARVLCCVFGCRAPYSNEFRTFVVESMLEQNLLTA